MKINAFITHKKAERFMDCQDRFSVNVDTKSIAVSDGMGSSWQQKIWASLLVEAFTSDSSWVPTRENISRLSYDWKKGVECFINELEQRQTSANCSDIEKKQILSQIYRNKRNLLERKSAGATLVGIRFLDGDKFETTVLGDSCLIVWDGTKAEFLTSQNNCEFDSYPDYFDSDPLKEGKGTVKNEVFNIEKNTYLFLVSDPFSEFLWERTKDNKIKDYIDELINLSSHEDFELLVDKWRREGMGNDDTTAIIISQDESKVLNKGIIDKIEEFIERETSSVKPANTTPQMVSSENVQNSTNNNEVNPEDLSKEIYHNCRKTWSGINIYNIIINNLRKILKIKKTESKSKFEELTINCIREVLNNYQIYKKS